MVINDNVGWQVVNPKLSLKNAAIDFFFFKQIVEENLLNFLKYSSFISMGNLQHKILSFKSYKTPDFNSSLFT